MAEPTSAAAELPSLLNKSHISESYAPGSIFDSRSLEEVHSEALAAAYAEHQRVYDTAVRVQRLHELRQAQVKIRQLALLEEERLRAETQKAQDEIRLRELQATKVPQPPPQAKVAPPPPPPAETPRPTVEQKPAAASSTTPASQSSTSTVQTPSGAPKPQPPTNPFASQKTNNTNVEPAQKPAAPAVRPPNPTPQQPQSQPASVAQPLRLPVFPTAERYVAIHAFLKSLRKHLAGAADANPEFKKKMGEMRRDIRKSVGQLTEGKGANKQPVAKIVETLIESLTTVFSPPVNPGLVMVITSKPPSIEGAANNEESLPILFIYLLNIFAKAIVSQFIDEAGVSPKAADPIGVVAVTIFAKPELLWRGQTLIDILMAKMRVACPVLFGLRGNEKTEAGRARLGWRKDGNTWIQEQEHNVRMTGLGSGYASIALRDFSKSKMKCPFPPTNYWQTMACIVSTPPNLASSTQYMVLKALIDGYEERFMRFYGHAAVAALKVALVDFPGRAPEHSVAVSSLKVLADKLQRDMGLRLDR